MSVAYGAERRGGIRGGWDAFVRPRADGLPNWRVVTVVPALLVIAFIVAVATGVSGTSQGEFDTFFHTGSDPRLIAGEPRAGRSDEWLVQTGWALSQVAQGFPAVNETFPGGMDATFQNELPANSWVTAFRPHTWGFMFLGADGGMAVRWWFPALVVTCGAYLLTVTLLPRRPVTGLMLAGAAYFSPLVTWWWLPQTTLPLGWSMLAMAAVWWSLVTERRWERWVLAALTGYLAVTMGMTIYAPYIIACLLPFAAFALGAVILHARLAGVGRVLGRLVPLAACGIAAGGVVGAWIYTHRESFALFFSTVYPGQRVSQLGTVEPGTAIEVFAAAWNASLQDGVVWHLAANESESSTPFMVAVFLLPVLLFLVLRRTREHRIDWVALAITLTTLVALAYWFIPGWEPLAKLLLLDRTTGNRMRLAMVPLMILAVVWIARRFDSRLTAARLAPARPSFLAAGAAVALTLGIHLWVWLTLRGAGDPVLNVVTHYKVIVALLLLAVGLAALGRSGLAGTALLAASIFAAGGVNPLYRGAFDLADSPIGEAVEATPGGADGTWVGVGTQPFNAVLLHVGYEALNGVQTYPTEEMWQPIDPVGQYVGQWNRLANVNWVWGTGEPVVSNPAMDQIEVTLDPCSAYAQANVDFVLSQSPEHSQCASLVESGVDGETAFWIYDIVPAGS